MSLLTVIHPRKIAQSTRKFINGEVHPAPAIDPGAYNATGNHWPHLRAVGRSSFDAKKLCKGILRIHTAPLGCRRRYTSDDQSFELSTHGSLAYTLDTCSQSLTLVDQLYQSYLLAKFRFGEQDHLTRTTKWSESYNPTCH
jgi:hypothetical protein